MSPSMSLSAIIPLSIVIYAVYHLVSGKLRRSPLPPGPPGWPLIGNWFDVPRGPTSWIEYREMCKKYKSDILYLNVLGKPTVILNKLGDITELLEKRSAIYSNRPRFVMFRELIGADSFTTQPYGSYWRSHRRLFHTEFEASGKGTIWHHPYQIRSVHETLARLLKTPDRWQRHLRQQAGAMVLEVAYGFRALPDNDPYINLAERSMAYGLNAATGKFWVESLPWLKYVPAWVPGASFQTFAQAGRKVSALAIEVPFEDAKKAMANSTAKPSFTSRCLENIDPNKDIAYQHLVIKNTAGTMLGAGQETTTALLTTLILAMVKYPEVQAKAQRELDSVLGPNQLPSFADQDSLPYLTAIVKECLRWEPLLPFSVPHRSTADDIYNGYFIPAGTIVIPNTWAVLNDEDVYLDPETFNPDRYLTEDGKPNPSARDSDAAFGYGRRICPGRFMVRESVWLTAASILACFKIEKPMDEHGNAIEPAREYLTHIVRQPVPASFSCNITPRSKETAKIIGDLFISPE